MKNKLIEFIKLNPQLFILIVLITILSASVPSFATARNFMNILKQISAIAIVSCGLTMVIISGGLDLSVGSALSLLCVISVSLQPRSIVLALVVPLLAACMLGFFNGFISSFFQTSSIVVTLGSWSVFSGLALLYTRGKIIFTTENTFYQKIASGVIFQIPVYILIFIGFAIICEILLRKTYFGRALRYIGTNEEAARIAGIKVYFFKTIAFSICSISAALAGIILAARLNSASPASGTGFEFDAITAVVIGGISLRGGSGNIYNTVIGVLLLAVIINGLTLINVPYPFQNITKGVLISIALFIDIKLKRINEK